MENPKVKKFIAKIGLGGAVGMTLFVILGLMIFSPMLLIGGLNLMGFPVPFTIKTIFGAILVVLVLRSPSQK
ncbi:hypothetical protein EBU91_00455 [bacterium]|nr:hypothetical protein [bacterium]